MASTSSNYLESIEQTAEWLVRKNKEIKVTAEALLQMPNVHEMLQRVMDEENARRKAQWSKKSKENTIWKDSELQKEMSHRADGKGGRVSAEIYGGKWLLEWMEENYDAWLEACSRGGHTQSRINKEKGIGLYALTKEERQANGKKGVESYWANATEEEIKAKYDKSGKSIKKFIKENGYWNPHKYITDEIREEMAARTSATYQNKREQRIKNLYDAIETDDWFTLEYALEIEERLRGEKTTVSTIRRMCHGWPQAKKYFENGYIKTPEGAKKIAYKKIT